jgi:hypothetical protein
VRHLITSSAKWQGADGATPAPISQRDLMITWHSLATFIHRTLGRWKVDLTPAHSEGFLHVWQVTAHYLGVEHVYIPATWTDAQLQSDQTLDAVLGSTPEGVELAKELLGLLEDYDLGLTRPVLEAMARFLVGSNNAGVRVGDMLEIPANRALDTALVNGWPWFIQTRELGGRLPGSNKLFWTFDELLRLGVLWGLHGGPGPITIEVPTANRSEDSYPGPY